MMGTELLVLTERALHRIVALTLKVSSPVVAARTAREFGWMVNWIDRADGRTAAERVSGRGTCLSRALWIAARCPGAEVVIGVRRPSPNDPLRAHAWVEMNGRTICEQDEASLHWRTIARVSLDDVILYRSNVPECPSKYPHSPS